LRKQKNKLKVMLIISGVILLYIILFPISLTREVVVAPVWYDELTAADPAVRQEAVQGPVVPFRVGNLFGYVDLKGQLQHLGEVLFDVTQSDTAFINYPRVPENLNLQNTRGDVVASLPADGYPLLHPEGDKLFMFTKDSMGIRELNRTGQELWSAEFASLITSLSIVKEHVLVGLVNGKLKLFDNQGSLLYDAKMVSSQMPVVLGCAASNDGMELAGVSGLHPQKFFFVQREKFNNPVLFTTDLASDFRREVQVKFSQNGKYCFFEQEYGLGIFDVKTKTIKHFTPAGKRIQSAAAVERGRITGLEELEATGHLCLLWEKQKQTEIFLLQPVNLLFYRETIPFQNVFLKAHANHLFIGLTDTVVENNEQGDKTEPASARTRTYLLQCDFFLM
jgi:hypothetical protein